MLEIIGAIIGFGFLLFLLVYSFRMMEKEKKEIREYRQELLNSISQISLTIEEVFKERY